MAAREFSQLNLERGGRPLTVVLHQFGVVTFFESSHNEFSARRYVGWEFASEFAVVIGAVVRVPQEVMKTGTAVQ